MAFVFNLYKLTDIDDGMILKLWKFEKLQKIADWKFADVLKYEREVETLRNDLKLIFIWSEDWQMFSLNKCVVMHMNNSNLVNNTLYIIHDKRTEVTIKGYKKYGLPTGPAHRLATCSGTTIQENQFAARHNIFSQLCPICHESLWYWWKLSLGSLIWEAR